jgi:hypothetical protein
VCTRAAATEPVAAPLPAVATRRVPVRVDVVGITILLPVRVPSPVTIGEAA